MFLTLFKDARLMHHNICTNFIIFCTETTLYMDSFIFCVIGFCWIGIDDLFRYQKSRWWIQCQMERMPSSGHRMCALFNIKCCRRKPHGNSTSCPYWIFGKSKDVSHFILLKGLLGSNVILGYNNQLYSNDDFWSNRIDELGKNRSSWSSGRMVDMFFILFIYCLLTDANCIQYLVSCICQFGLAYRNQFTNTFYWSKPVKPLKTWKIADWNLPKRDFISFWDAFDFITRQYRQIFRRQNFLNFFSADIYALFVGIYLFDEIFDYLYLISFFIILSSLIGYHIESWRHEKQMNSLDQLRNVSCTETGPNTCPSSERSNLINQMT